MEQTNNSGEAIAVLVAAQGVPLETPLTIRSDSKIAIDGLTKNLQNWENRGWIGISNGNTLQAAAACLRARSGKVAFKKVKGHSGDVGNDGADQLAGEGALKHEADELNTAIPKNYAILGAKLSMMTQALLYQGLIERQPRGRERQGTLVNLDKI